MAGKEEGVLRYRSHQYMSPKRAGESVTAYDTLRGALRKHVQPSNGTMGVRDFDQCTTGNGNLFVRIDNVEKMSVAGILSDLFQAGYRGMDFMIESGTSGLIEGVFRIPLQRTTPRGEHNPITIDEGELPLPPPTAGDYCVSLAKLIVWLLLITLVCYAVYAWMPAVILATISQQPPPPSSPPIQTFPPQEKKKKTEATASPIVVVAAASAVTKESEQVVGGGGGGDDGDGDWVDMTHQQRAGQLPPQPHLAL